MLVLSEMLKVVWGPNQIAAIASYYLKEAGKLAMSLLLNIEFLSLLLDF